MNGIIIIDKPLGISSHACVSRLRKVFKTKKVGHSGTLDVEASGVLVLGINQGTKLLNYLNQDDKTYHFGIRFGQTTETLDHTGSMLTIQPIEALDRFDETLATFLGSVLQQPPAYSAVKVAGKKLYEYARQGIAMPPTHARPMTIHKLERVAPIVEVENGFETSLQMTVSKGFYIRQFAADLAKKWHTVAHTTSIRRYQAGHYAIDEAIPLDAVDSNTVLISPAAALRDLESYCASASDLQRIAHGQSLEIRHFAQTLKVVDTLGNLVAIYVKEGDRYCAKNVFLVDKSEGSS